MRVADLVTVTGVLSDVTSRHRVPPPADCTSNSLPVARHCDLIRFRFAFVEYESRRDADDAYHEMHNKRIGRDDLLKIEVRIIRLLRVNRVLTTYQWARTPPSASWRFDSGRDRRRDRTPPRRGRSPSPRRGRDYSPRRDDRYERDYDRHDRDYERRDRDYDRRDRDYERRDRDRSRDRSRSPDERERDIKDDRPRDDERERRDDERENGPNGEERKGMCPSSATVSPLLRTRAHQDSSFRFHDVCS